MSVARQIVDFAIKAGSSDIHGKKVLPLLSALIQISKF